MHIHLMRARVTVDITRDSVPTIPTSHTHAYQFVDNRTVSTSRLDMDFNALSRHTFQEEIGEKEEEKIKETYIEHRCLHIPISRATYMVENSQNECSVSSNSISAPPGRPNRVLQQEGIE